jgi:hypothetical protein
LSTISAFFTRKGPSERTLEHDFGLSLFATGSEGNIFEAKFRQSTGKKEIIGWISPALPCDSFCKVSEEIIALLSER